MPITAPLPFASAPTSQSLVQAITVATICGSWGNVCFVVRLSGQHDRKHAVLWADLCVLRASGASQLADKVVQRHFRTEGEAKDALFEPSRSQCLPAASQQESVTSRRIVLAPHTSNLLYFPLPGICYTTMSAILVYLQTGLIDFAPLTSTIVENERKSADDSDDSDNTDTFMQESQETTEPTGYRMTHDLASGDLAVSPKSVYRAARKFRLAGLCKLASEAIHKQITPDNCLRELFSKFGLQYPEILRKRLRYVLTHWNEIENRIAILQLVSSSALRPRAIEVLETILAHTSIEGTCEHAYDLQRSDGAVLESKMLS